MKLYLKIVFINKNIKCMLYINLWRIKYYNQCIAIVLNWKSYILSQKYQFFTNSPRIFFNKNFGKLSSCWLKFKNLFLNYIWFEIVLLQAMTQLIACLFEWIRRHCSRWQWIKWVREIKDFKVKHDAYFEV